MPKLSKEDINEIAKTFIELKDKSDRSKKDRLEYENYQNYCADKLSLLVDFKTNKYRKFSNYPDLKQDGLEALMLAFETYRPEKGDFTWWASKYIGTRVSRAANAHSTIRIPLKKAKDMQPYKTNVMPVMIDNDDPEENVENAERSGIIRDAISTLPNSHKKAILMYYDFIDGKKSTISNISKELKISRPTCVKILNEAERALKGKLKDVLSV